MTQINVNVQGVSVDLGIDYEAPTRSSGLEHAPESGHLEIHQVIIDDLDCSSVLKIDAVRELLTEAVKEKI